MVVTGSDPKEPREADQSNGNAIRQSDYDGSGGDQIPRGNALNLVKNLIKEAKDLQQQERRDPLGYNPVQSNISGYINFNNN